MLANGALVHTALVALPNSVAVSTTILVADVGPFTLSGQAVLFAVTQPSAAGPFTFTGVNAVLTPTIIGGIGTYALTGKAALFSVNWVESAGAFIFTGRAATLTPAILAGAGAYMLSGMSALLLPGLEHGSFALTGNDAALTPLIIPTTRRPLMRRGAGTFWRGVS